jgi:hypothetical protein
MNVWVIVFVVSCVVGAVGIFLLFGVVAQSAAGFSWSESKILLVSGCLLLIVGIGVPVLIWHLGLLPASFTR